jgi:hypothetical protein
MLTESQGEPKPNQSFLRSPRSNQGEDTSTFWRCKILKPPRWVGLQTVNLTLTSSDLLCTYPQEGPFFLSFLFMLAKHPGRIVSEVRWKMACEVRMNLTRSPQLALMFFTSQVTSYRQGRRQGGARGGGLRPPMLMIFLWTKAMSAPYFCDFS